MAEYNGKEGRWVTSNGRHIFISDDPAEKQEKEIAAQKSEAEKLNAEKKEQDRQDRIKELIAEYKHLYDKYPNRAEREKKLAEINKEYNSLLVKKETLDEKDLKSFSSWLGKKYREDENIYPDDILNSINDEWGFENGYQVSLRNLPIMFVHHHPDQTGIGEWFWESDDTVHPKYYDRAYRFLDTQIDKNTKGESWLSINVADELKEDDY